MSEHNKQIGIVGYGEVGRVITDMFVKQGTRPLVVNRSPDRLRAELAEEPIDVAESIADLSEQSDFIISCVWPKTALDVATAAAPGIDSETWFLDTNSISPQVTADIQRVVTEQSGAFQKAIILDSAAKKGADMLMLLSGTDAEAITSVLTDAGLNVQWVDHAVNETAAIKLCRSIFTKGLRGLFIETLLLAREYNVEEDALLALSNLFDERSVDEWGTYMIATGPDHAQRRVSEIDDILGMMDTVGLRSPATDQSLQLHKLLSNDDVGGETYGEVLDSLYPYYNE